MSNITFSLSSCKNYMQIFYTGAKLSIGVLAVIVIEIEDTIIYGSILIIQQITAT